MQPGRGGGTGDKLQASETVSQAERSRKNSLHATHDQLEIGTDLKKKEKQEREEREIEEEEKLNLEI